MNRISIELVPRDSETLTRDMELVHQHFPTIDILNIPDLLKFKLRSWEACQLARPWFPQAIAHLRAIDFDARDPQKLLDILQNCKISQVLVINGDQPQDMSRRVYRTSSVELIRTLKRARPDLTVYAGIDPYRSGVKAELDYVRRKQDAGADGFFTQPFFDLRLLEIFHGLIGDLEVFWGVSPVMSERSKDYWDNLNNAIFPPDFAPTLEWNRNFAKRALAFCKSTDSSIYFMPIRIDIADYLEGLI